MIHYKERKNHVFEFGETSILRITLTTSQYNELAQYFALQQIKESFVVSKSAKSKRKVDDSNAPWNWKKDSSER